MWNRYCQKSNPIVRAIFIKMLAPTILMNLATAIASMADTMIIGHFLDDASLSVVTFAMPIYMVINTFAALFSVGGCIAMSIDAGKGEKENANRAFSLAIELLALVGVVLLIAGLFFSRTVAGWLGPGEDVFEEVRAYSQVILLGAPIFLLRVGIAFFVRNDGRPTLSMVGMFASIVVDVILNFVFVGYMDLGVAGAAYSTVIGQLVGVIIIGIHFLSSKNTLKFRFTCSRLAFRIVQNGISAALQFIYQFVTILIINHFLAKLAGTNGVVVYTVVFNLATVSLSVFEGISQTIQPMISNYFGEKSYKNIKQTLRLAFVAIVVICGSVTAILEIAPQIIPNAFGIEDALLVSKSAVAVRIYTTSMIITTVNVVIGYYLQSTEHNSMAAILISLRSFVIFLTATLVLGKLFGMNGVWAAYVVAEVLSFVICLFMIRLKQKKLANANILLLDGRVEQEIERFTLLCREQDHGDFCSAVIAHLAQHPKVRDHVLQDAQAYLARLEKCDTGKKGKYIELELNGCSGKVIIRDNLHHPDGIQDSISHGSKADYGPVLGWNRICLE